MHQIGVVGLSYRHVGVDEVARFALPKAEIAARLPALRDFLRASEILYVGTCNRVEVLFATSDGSPAGDSRGDVFRALTGRDPQPGEATRILRAWTGEAAVEHLFLVACGLDSAQTGEQEIAIQLRGAWEAAREAHASGPILDRLLGEALGMANRVHRLEAGVRAPSLADLAADRAVLHLAGKPGTVALVGVSPMTKRCGKALHRAGVPLLVVNRTLEAAEEFAQTVGAQALSLDEFRARPREVAALVLAAGGGEPVLDTEALARLAHVTKLAQSNALAQAATLAQATTPAQAATTSYVTKIAQAATSSHAATLPQVTTRPPLIIDFGVPPNVEPEAARLVGFPRVGMNDLIQAAQERRLSQLMRMAPVRAAIDERLTRLRGDLATRAIGRKLADLRGTFEQIAAEEVDRALAAELRGLDDSQREILQRLGSTVARRLAHLPLAGLRAAAAHASTDAVDAFFREAKLRRTPVAGTGAGNDTGMNGTGIGAAERTAMVTGTDDDDKS
ncbi:MAG: Glutamyl-tRNA reductase [Gammaproteobacteria bacterium]|nr:Glutamyl-tRNA reductase [Gammaproteobacteria bacterium]